MAAHEYRTAEEWRLDPYAMQGLRTNPTPDEDDIAMPGGSREVGANLRKMSFEELIDGYLSGRLGFSRELIITILRDRFIQVQGMDPAEASKVAESFVTKRELEREQGFSQAPALETAAADTSPFAAFTPSGPVTPTSRPVTTPATPFAPVRDEREQTFLEAGIKPEQVFARFLSRPQFQGLSSLGQRALEGQYGPARASFLASGGLGENFRDFLGSGRGILNSQEMLGRLGQISGLFDQDAASRDPLQQELVDRFTPSETAFQTFINTFMRSVDPAFRQSTYNAARGIFNRFMDVSPDVPFIKELPKAFSGFLQ